VAGKAPPRKVLAVDWDARTLRVVHANLGKRGVKIERMLSVAIPSGLEVENAEAMGQHIRRVLDQEGISTKHAIVDIPRDQAILKTLTLPAAQTDELAGIVEIQIAKELPFPVSEAVIDFAVGPQAADKPTVDALVAAVQREVRKQYESIFTHAGLRLDRIGLRPYAHMVAINKLLQFAMPERVMFIDVRPTLTEIDVLREGRLTFSRAASVMIPSDLTEHTAAPSLRRAKSPEELEGTASSAPVLELRVADDGSSLTAVKNSLLVEVTRSIEAYRAVDPGVSIDHVIISGDLGVEEALAEAVQERLKVTTELYNPAAIFGWEPDEGAAASGFAATLGLVLGHAEAGALQFDFLHPKRRGAGQRQKWRKVPAIAAVAVLFVGAAAMGVSQYRKDDREKLEQIEVAIKELSSQKDENEKFIRLVQQVKDFDAEQHVWIDVLQDVFSQLPTNQELVVMHSEMDQSQGRMVLKTKAKNRDTATIALNKLHAFRREGRTLPRFKAVIGPQSEKKGEVYPFLQDLRILILDDRVKEKREGAKGRP